MSCCLYWVILEERLSVRVLASAVDAEVVHVLVLTIERTLHVSDSSSVQHQEYCTHSNGICHTGLLTACEQDQDGVPEINLRN